MDVIPPITVQPQGFGWTAAGAWVTVLTVLGGIITLIIKQVGPWHKQNTDAADKMIETLTDRVKTLENRLELDRRLHFIQIARIEARHAAQRSLDRHKFNNSEACLEALLIRLEAGQSVHESVKLVREMRAHQKDSERAEGAVIHAAEMAAVEQAEHALERELAEEEDRLKG